MDSIDLIIDFVLLVLALVFFGAVFYCVFIEKPFYIKDPKWQSWIRIKSLIDGLEGLKTFKAGPMLCFKFKKSFEPWLHTFVIEWQEDAKKHFINFSYDPREGYSTFEIETDVNNMKLLETVVQLEHAVTKLKQDKEDVHTLLS